MTSTLEIVLFLACLLGVALFEGTETALLVSDRLRLRASAKARHLGTDLSLDLMGRRDQVIITLLTGSTLMGTAVAAIATSLVEDLMGATALAAAVTSISVTIVLLIFGQVLPKGIARQYPELVLTGAARPLFAIDLLFLPVTAGVRGLARVLRGGRRGVLMTREEIKLLAQDVRTETGTLRQEKRMLQSILDFGTTTAREVMVPMPAVVSLDCSSSIDMLRAVVRRRPYTRIPVFERRVDRVVGVVNVFDALSNPDAGETIESHLRPITMVPETKRIDRLMVEMQRRGESMVVVVNEFGSCTGILTMEDIVEEIMGEIADEHEVGVRRIRPLGEGVFIVDALTDIDDINEELSLDLPKLRYDTVGGLVLRRLGRIPQEGERFEVNGVEFEVVEAYPYGVRTVKMTLSSKAGDNR